MLISIYIYQARFVYYNFITEQILLEANRCTNLTNNILQIGGDLAIDYSILGSPLVQANLKEQLENLAAVALACHHFTAQTSKE